MVKGRSYVRGEPASVAGVEKQAKVQSSSCKSTDLEQRFCGGSGKSGLAEADRLAVSSRNKGLMSSQACEFESSSFCILQDL